MDRDDKEERRKRIQNIRKIIIILLVVLILLPTVLCIILFTKISKLSDELDRLRQLKIERVLVAEKRVSENNMLQSMVGFAKCKVDKQDLYKEQKFQVNIKKKAYLTFDDGPSINTDKVLKILDK